MIAGVDFPKALVELLLHDKKPGPTLPLHDVYARNLSREVKWMKLIAKRRGRASPYELTRPIGKSLVEWARLATGIEKMDGMRFDDAGPFARELGNVVRSELKAARGSAERAITRRMARRTSLARARKLRDARRVLVLCHGNICRSAYAGRVLEGSREIRSAGFYDVPNRETPQDFQRVALRHGVDLSSHRSRVVSDDDVSWADVVVIMDLRNFTHFRERFPKDTDKVVWLGALDGGAIEIDDPYGLGDEAAERVLSRIDACLARLTAGDVATHA